MVAANALGSAPLISLRLSKIRSAQPLIILNLHRVAPAHDAIFPPLPPALFDELLRFVTRHFAVTSFGRLGEDRTRPQLILSFDDGYRDFIDHALPLLTKYAVTAHVNVIPHCAETGRPPLQVQVAQFLSSAPEELAKRLSVPGFDAKEQRGRWRRFDSLLRALPHKEQERIAETLIPQMERWDGFRPLDMLRPSEIAEISSHTEIGGHSFEHASMAMETDDYLRKDVERCRAWIKAVTGKPMLIYAFPNGSYRPGQPRLVREWGVDHVLLAGGGFGGRDGIHDRIGVSAASRREVRFRALGAHAPLPRPGQGF
jgi:peptidoglycan/xylan/chitin deacetylase (PgdA/CDA1 family)